MIDPLEDPSQVTELKERLMGYIFYENLGDEFDEAELSELSEQFNYLAGQDLEGAVKVGMDNLGITEDNFGELYAHAKVPAEVDSMFTKAICRLSPLFGASKRRKSLK